MVQTAVFGFTIALVALASGAACAEDLPFEAKAGLGAAGVAAAAVLISSGKSNAELVTTTSPAPNVGTTTGAATGPGGEGPGMLSPGGAAGIGGATGSPGGSPGGTQADNGDGSSESGSVVTFLAPNTGIVAVFGTAIGTVASGTTTSSSSSTSP